MSKPRIIKVTPTEQYFSINWQLAIRCNYDCMYCSPEWHNDHSQHHDLDTMKRAWEIVYAKTHKQNRKYKIGFTGGEMTTNKHFLPFVSWLRTEYGQHIDRLILPTNGSASYKYYLKVFEHIDNIAFSVHSEHINEKKFFDMMIQLKQNLPVGRFMQVVIMDEFWNQDRIPSYVKILQEHDISYTVNKVDYFHQTRQIPIFKGKRNLEI
jgi:molybdenum cofactor biosynthesis enzyme MoaA